MPARPDPPLEQPNKQDEEPGASAPGSSLPLSDLGAEHEEREIERIEVAVERMRRRLPRDLGD
jgi:hypothetical protein